eukprot:scaffold26053_cov127-Cylindrotheca_fusiformis.AAC.1
MGSGLKSVPSAPTRHRWEGCKRLNSGLIAMLRIAAIAARKMGHSLRSSSTFSVSCVHGHSPRTDFVRQMSRSTGL